MQKLVSNKSKETYSNRMQENVMLKESSFTETPGKFTGITHTVSNDSCRLKLGSSQEQRGVGSALHLPTEAQLMMSAPVGSLFYRCPLLLFLSS